MNEYINHFNAIRLRVLGSGVLESELRSYSDSVTAILSDITMAATSERFVTILANFIQPCARLKLSTDSIDEVFNISQIIIYAKPVSSGYPQ